MHLKSDQISEYPAQVPESAKYDVVVIGAGHAGCEAGLIAARMGQKTAMFCTDIESVAMMPCNPSIGGTGKGHLVREIDALGGEMGLATDKTFIQTKMLNTSKGPAVHSLRAQADKHRYHDVMLETIENQANLDLKVEEITELIIEDKDDGKQSIVGVIGEGNVYPASCVIICTGTFLGGKIFIGDDVTVSGPAGLRPSCKLAENLYIDGFPMRRFKTGTPARMLRDTIDYSKMKEQKGDDVVVPFSFMNEGKEYDIDQISCWLSYTNKETHKIILDNIEKSAMYSGNIVGVGPRYCPSIEDKIARFQDRERHQLFVEPEGLETDWMYIQGMSSSLPEDVQHAFYATIPGLEHATIVKPAYAIEYDCIDPLSMRPSLESKIIGGLFCAGQFNGSSGYEEAASQGLIAGINAVRLIQGKEALVLGRDQAYIGVLIDDLVTKGTNEPYRIMTSRAEYRLLLRQDNADRRLTEIGYEYGSVSEERYQKYLIKKQHVDNELERLKTVRKQGVSLYDLLGRPENTYDGIADLDPDRPELTAIEKTEVEVEIKYAGYIRKQIHEVEKMRKLETKKLRDDLDYFKINGLRIEAQQKLSKIRPITVGQASRISGVSPADINVLLVWLEKEYRNGN
ncbi:MAG: tRNA uridine-5-carboxymethylaminomethyl(34) synthesis enzyme MnmG [Clostridiales bacterium]|nr:tRNA uridine-5-carboxymethylaminomethyl(34) synthesis enzyme MnmG [Candidatus Crickella equi]